MCICWAAGWRLNNLETKLNTSATRLYIPSLCYSDFVSLDT